MLQARKDAFGLRPDGEEYVWTENIVPYRIYVGRKGYMEDGKLFSQWDHVSFRILSYCLSTGSEASDDDFLARNGLRYGQMYGYAVDMSEDGPTGGVYRDEFHRDPSKGFNGAMVEGKWIAIDWRWDGVVRNFEFDGAWDFQLKPPGTESGTEFEAYQFWNGNGLNEAGAKTEHLSSVSHYLLLIVIVASRHRKLTDNLILGHKGPAP